MTAAAVVSVDPWTGETVFAREADDPAPVVGRAADAAAEWAPAATEDRAAVLRRFAALLEREAATLTGWLVAEVGKRSADAAGEVAWAARTARFYADHPPPVATAGGAVVHRRPLGVVAAITPFNVPLVTPLWKLLPALMAGNTVVWKPSERASGTALATAGLLREAGLPAGVAGVAYGGPEVARALCADTRVALVHVTGSAAAGREVALATAGRDARCALELSGVNPALVFADADLERAAEAIVGCATALAGQKCTATRRVLVAEAVAEPLLERLAARVAGLRVGDPRDPATDVGPLISHAAVARAHAAVRASLTGGAELAAQADARGPAAAACFGPALLRGLAGGDPLRREEHFAPLLAVEAFGAEADAWTRADATPFGLSASVFSTDAERLRRAPERLRAGVVALNRRGDDVHLEVPFAGAKASGNGVAEGGVAAYDGVTSVQAVYGAPEP